VPALPEPPAVDLPEAPSVEPPAVTAPPVTVPTVATPPLPPPPAVDLNPAVDQVAGATTSLGAILAAPHAPVSGAN
jgi:hypothetical protein